MINNSLLSLFSLYKESKLESLFISNNLNYSNEYILYIAEILTNHLSILNIDNHKIRSILKQHQKIDKLSLFFCPGRINLSNHADYVNNYLLSFADNKGIFTSSSFAPLQKYDIVIQNTNSKFRTFKLNLNQLSSFNKDNKYKHHWAIYIIKIIHFLCFDPTQNSKIREQISQKIQKHKILISINSNLPSASGLSSSHALMQSCFFSLTYLLQNDKYINLFQQVKNFKNYNIELDSSVKSQLKDYLKISQNIEHQLGFKSGLGDQSAQLFSKINHLSLIRVEPEIKITYHKIPDEISFILVTTNQKIKKTSNKYKKSKKAFLRYSELNTLKPKHCKQIEFFNDILHHCTDEQIKIFINSIPDSDIRNLSLFALSSGLRLEKLSENIDIGYLCQHIQLNHQAEYIKQKYQYTPLTKTTKLDSLSGYYGASTELNDDIYDFCIQYQQNKPKLNYLASSIMGAGLGGCNIICISSSDVDLFTQKINKYFYEAQKPCLARATSNNLELHQII